MTLTARLQPRNSPESHLSSKVRLSRLSHFPLASVIHLYECYLFLRSDRRKENQFDSPGRGYDLGACASPLQADQPGESFYENTLGRKILEKCQQGWAGAGARSTSRQVLGVDGRNVPHWIWQNQC